MDENLRELEERAARNAVRYARIAAAVVCVVAIGGATFLIYRRTRKGPLEHLPPVTVTVNDHASREPGIVEAIFRKVAPALVGTASTALLARLARSGPLQPAPQPD